MKKTIVLLLALFMALNLCACGEKEDAATLTDTLEAAPAAVTVLDASYVEYYDGTATTRFRRDADKWVWADNEAFPLDNTCVDEILTGAAAFSTLTALPDTDETAGYGLAAAETYLTLTLGETYFTYRFGKEAPDGSTYMACEGAEDTVYQVPDTFMALLRRGIYDMALLPTLPVLTADNCQNIITENADEEIVTMYKSDTVWKSGGKDVTARMEPVLAALGKLAVEDCFDFDPSPAAVSLCGFDVPAMTLTVCYVNSVDVDATLVLRVGVKQENSGLYCVMLEGDDSIYLMADEVLDPLLAISETGMK